jgi:hypothetical protein
LPLTLYACVVLAASSCQSAVVLVGAAPAVQMAPNVAVWLVVSILTESVGDASAEAASAADRIAAATIMGIHFQLNPGEVLLNISVLLLGVIDG